MYKDAGLPETCITIEEKVLNEAKSYVEILALTYSFPHELLLFLLDHCVLWLEMQICDCSAR